MRITLNGQSYPLRASFATLYALEEELGMGLITLAGEVAAGRLTLRQSEAIIRAGLRGAGESIPEPLGPLLLVQGLATLAAPVAQFLHLALTGEDAAGKA